MFFLASGKVRLESRSPNKSPIKFGEISSDSDWPIFCEASALGLITKKTSCTIVADCACKIRVIPSPVILSVLFGPEKASPERAILFFEIVSRHYAQKLVGIGSRHLAPIEEKRKGKGRFSPRELTGCMTVNEEAIIYTWKCTYRKKFHKYSGIVSLTNSFLAFIKLKDGEIISGDVNAFPAAEILRLNQIDSVGFEKKNLIKIEVKDQKIFMVLNGRDGETFVETIRRFLDDHKMEKLKKASGSTDFNPQGLTLADCANLSEVFFFLFFFSFLFFFFIFSFFSFFNFFPLLF